MQKLLLYLFAKGAPYADMIIQATQWCRNFCSICLQRVLPTRTWLFKRCNDAETSALSVCKGCSLREHNYSNYFSLSKSVPPVATLTGNYKHTLQDNTVREEQSFFCLCSEYKEKSKIKPQISFSIFFYDWQLTRSRGSCKEIHYKLFPVFKASFDMSFASNPLTNSVLLKSVSITIGRPLEGLQLLSTIAMFNMFLNISRQSTLSSKHAVVYADSQENSSKV